MRIEKSQGYNDSFDVISDRVEKRRYKPEDVRKIIDGLDVSIQKFQQQKEYWQNIYEQGEITIRGGKN